jgi:tetratricopeptide (TPR) repeat protein
MAMSEGQAAFVLKDYSNAVLKADIALGIKPNDPAAGKLKSDAQAELVKLADAAAREQQRKYGMAMSEGQAAFVLEDYPIAMAKADEALGYKPGDSAATQLKADAKKQSDLAEQVKVQEQKYQAAMTEGRAALGRKDYPTAMANADEALGIKKGDSAATQLKADAKKQSDLAEEVRAAQAEQLKQLDARLIELLDSFNVAVPTGIIRPPGTKKGTRLGSISFDDKEGSYLPLALSLKANYEKGGWLNQNGRKQALEALTKSINTWP